MISHKNKIKKQYKKVYVYRLTNPDGEVYIGITGNPVARLKKFNYTKNQPDKMKKQGPLYNSFKKHGVENHKMVVIFEKEYDSLNIQEASDIEQDFILRYWIEYRSKLLNSNIKGLMKRWRDIWTFLDGK